MASSSKLFLLGPGFLGGGIIRLLLREGKYDITTMVRRQDAAPAFEKLGVNVVLATLDDGDIISKHAAQSDTIIHTATADHKPSVESVIRGIKERASQGKSTIFIHTSGTSLVSDDAAGEFVGEKIFYDDRPEDLDALPDSASHRQIDLTIVRAREQLKSAAKLAIMIPPLIYGVSQDQRLSIQLPTLTRYSIKHGYGGHIGKGLSVWSQIHVADLARAYVLLLHWLEGDESDEIYINPYFFCENGHELTWASAATEIGQNLFKIGKVQSPNTQTIPKQNYGDLFGSEFTETVIGSNSRSRANRLRKLGWQPREKQALESLREDELPLILQDSQPFTGYSKPVAS